MTTQPAATLLGVPRTNIPNMESGRSGISPERVRTLADNYGCTERELIDALAAMANPGEKGWWERYRGRLPAGFLDIAELEWHSVALRIALTVHLPGLLQTEAHARAVFEAVFPRLDPAEVDDRVAHRMDRQRVLDRADPPEVDVILHEAALRMEFGGRDVARQQLGHILTTTERDNVTLRVIPFSAGGFPGAGQSVVYASARVPALDTVELDSTHGPEFIDARAQLDKYRAQLDAMQATALSAAESRIFVRALADSFEEHQP